MPLPRPSCRSATGDTRRRRHAASTAHSERKQRRITHPFHLELPNLQACHRHIRKKHPLQLHKVPFHSLSLLHPDWDDHLLSHTLNFVPPLSRG
jgi:hypothetical protein